MQHSYDVRIPGKTVIIKILYLHITGQSSRTLYFNLIVKYSDVYIVIKAVISMYDGVYKYFF